MLVKFVKNVLPICQGWRHTEGFTQENNHMPVNFVKKGLPRVPVYNATEEFTPGKNHMVAIFVKNDSPAVVIWAITWKITTNNMELKCKIIEICLMFCLISLRKSYLWWTWICWTRHIRNCRKLTMTSISIDYVDIEVLPCWIISNSTVTKTRIDLTKYECELLHDGFIYPLESIIRAKWW